MDRRTRTLSPQAAKEIDSRRQKTTNWLNPISMSRLQKAVNDGETGVVLDGMKFSITYGIKRTSSATGEELESIMLKRTDGQFVPFAYISLKRIKEFDFAKGE